MRLGYFSGGVLGAALLLAACGDTREERALSGALAGAAAGGLLGVVTTRDRYDDRGYRYDRSYDYDRRYQRSYDDGYYRDRYRRTY